MPSQEVQGITWRGSGRRRTFCVWPKIGAGIAAYVIVNARSFWIDFVAKLRSAQTKKPPPKQGPDLHCWKALTAGSGGDYGSPRSRVTNSRRFMGIPNGSLTVDAFVVSPIPLGVLRREIERDAHLPE